jgi:hypothetical protein
VKMKQERKNQLRPLRLKVLKAVTLSISIGLALSLLSLQAFGKPDPEVVKRALESTPTCSNFVRYDDDNIYLGFGYYRRWLEEPRNPIPATLRIVPLLSPEKVVTLTTADAAIDSVRFGNSLFILTYSGIEEWDLSANSRQALYATYAFPGVMAYMEHAQAFARYGDKVIIAHGRLGISIFSLKTKRLVNQFRILQSQLPLESMATGVTVEGKYAYVIMDNFSLVENGEPAFRGIVVIDLEKEAVVTEMKGLDPGADSVASDGNKLIVSYGGNPIWKYSLSNLHGYTLPPPENTVRPFPVDGHPIGSAAMDEKYYYSCFSKAPPKAWPESQRASYKKIPVALERHSALLD